MRKYLLVLVLLFLPVSQAYTLSDQASGVRARSTSALVGRGNLTVHIYDALTGGTLVYNETFTNAIKNGTWNVMLGEGVSLPLVHNQVYYKDYLINGEDATFKNSTGGDVSRLVFYAPVGSSDPVLWTNTSNNATFTSGRVGIGTATPETILDVRLVDTSYLRNAYTTDFWGSASIFSLAYNPAQHVNSSIQRSAILSAASAIGSNNIGKIQAVHAEATNYNTANVTELVAISGYAYNWQMVGNAILARLFAADFEINNIGEKNVTLAAGINIDVKSASSGQTQEQIGILINNNSVLDSHVVMNRYGIFIREAIGNVTYNDYSIYQEGLQKVYFRGNLGINAKNSTSTLYANGTIRTNITSCSDALETDAYGNIICGTDQTGPAGDSIWTNSSGNATFSGFVGINVVDPQVYLHVNGTLRLNFTSCSAIETDSNGDVGCGTSYPTVWTNSSNNATIDARVGVGVAAPLVTVHINNTIMLQPTDSPVTCTASIEGSIYADDTLNIPCYCNSTDWVRMDNFSSTC